MVPLEMSIFIYSLTYIFVSVSWLMVLPPIQVCCCSFLSSCLSSLREKLLSPLLLFFLAKGYLGLGVPLWVKAHHTLQCSQHRQSSFVVLSLISPKDFYSHCKYLYKHYPLEKLLAIHNAKMHCRCKLYILSSLLCII